MPLIATRGAASAQGFGEFAQQTAANYIEDVFSTWLYTGTGAAQTITNGIDLSTKGGFVWIKDRTLAENHNVFDTARGAGYQLITNETGAQGFDAQRLSAFTTSGFSLGTRAAVNQSGSNFVSWTFREQPKFFDVLTYTGNGSTQAISHNLGSTVGCIIVKRTSAASNTGWAVYHRSLGETRRLFLNLKNASTTAQEETWFGNNTVSVAPTSTQFTVGSNQDVNASGNTYVAYLFAHDAGGFGLTGTDNVISCGSYTGNGVVAGPSVTLGYEPQWVLIKSSTVAGSDWYLMDNMRGMAYTQCNELYPNLTAAEVAQSKTIIPTATGFDVATTDAYINNNGSTYIYIAIRRGPMKVPTTGTSVFSPDLYTGNGTTQTVTSGSPPLDLVWIKGRTGSNNPRLYDRLRGATKALAPDSTAAETTRADGLTAFTQTGFTVGSFGNENESGVSIIAWDFRRAPGFFDEVCYVGNDAANTQTHNLGVKPELVISKSRSAATNGSWGIWSAGNGVVNNDISGLTLNSNAAAAYPNFGNSSKFTATTFGADWVLDANGDNKNQTGVTYVTYLFATCAGVSKVGSYTGTGTTKQIDCGFTGGARFVLIKRTDSTGDWYVWDSARGIIAGNDPYLLLNTSTNEVTNTDYIDTAATGFEISSTAPAAINASGGTFIFLAVA